MAQPSITILGAGLQGSCVALGLARRGFRSTVVERLTEPMSGASLINEGKIHLGFIYALASKGETRRRMLEGAMTFAPILDELCGDLPWRAWRSEEFHYAVMPDSLADPATLESAYDHLASMVPAIAGSQRVSTHYLGQPLRDLWRRSRTDRGRPLVDGHPVEHCYETEEVAIDPRCLSAAVVESLRREPRIEVRCDQRVRRARRNAAGFELELESPQGRETLATDIVVNCTWADRIRLDRCVGIAPPAAVSYRVKYQVLVRPRSADSSLAPVTMIQGPYGDLVPWAGRIAYISWYPACRTYLGEKPPPEMVDDRGTSQRVARQALRAMSDFFPALDGARILASRPGIIIARGTSDVHDPTSGLHERREFGPQCDDGWWTVETGKLTTAPLNADRTVEWIEHEIGHAVA